MTFGTSDQTTKEVLEAKVKGLIRSNISSGPLPTQSAVKHVLKIINNSIKKSNKIFKH